MPRRRNFLKCLAAGAVALGIGTVEAVKAAPVATPDAVTVDLAKVDPTMSDAQESGYAVEQRIAKLRGPGHWANNYGVYLHHVDPASIWPVWSDGQLSEIMDTSPPSIHEPYEVPNTPQMQALNRRFLAQRGYLDPNA